MSRTLPPKVAEFLALAVKDKLDEPLGRALYCQNRKLNASSAAGIEIMRSAKTVTAIRWREHWEAGGCLYGLWSEAEQQQKVEARRLREIERLPDGERMRKMVRHIRRREKKETTT